MESRLRTFFPSSNLLSYQMSPGTVTSRWVSFLRRANYSCLPWRQPLGRASWPGGSRGLQVTRACPMMLLEICAFRDWVRHTRGLEASAASSYAIDQSVEF